jgi:L-alanine-DL-glutamate epimerase-like enolase superfamily enzyme
MDAEGMVHVPLDRPGLGITVDREFIESLTVRTEELRGSSRPVAVA